MVVLIEFAYMAHDSGKCSLVRLECCFAEWRDSIHLIAPCIAGSEVCCSITLDPVGHVGEGRILGCTKPERHQLQMMAASAFNNPIHQVKVELTRFTLQ